MRAKERLYLTEDRSEVVNENDRRGRFLFCKRGDEIPDELARKYGLLKDEMPPEPEPSKPPKKSSVKKKVEESGLIINRLDGKVLK